MTASLKYSGETTMIFINLDNYARNLNYMHIVLRSIKQNLNSAILILINYLKYFTELVTIKKIIHIPVIYLIKCLSEHDADLIKSLSEHDADLIKCLSEHDADD